MKRVLIGICIACSLAFIFTTIGFNNSYIKKNLNLDLVEYFVSGNVIREHNNPYSYDIQTEKQCTKNLEYKEEWGIKKSVCPTIFYNPPIAITPSILISYINNYKLASYVWSFFIIFVYICCFLILYDLFVLYSRDNFTSVLKKEKVLNYYLFLTIVFFFKPFIDNLIFGQISFLLLLGLTLSIYFEKNNKPFWSAFFLSITSIKPHSLYLYYFFWFFFADNKCSKIKGFLIGVVVLSILPLVYNPHIYSFYIDFISSNLPSEKWFSATIGAWINFHFFKPFSNPLYAFLPTIITTLISLIILLKFKIKKVSLFNRALVIIPLSLFTTPYGWGFDMITLLPTLCVYYYIIIEEINVNQRSKIALLGYLLLVNILFMRINLQSFILVSLSHLLFSCYLVVLRKRRRIIEEN